MLFVPVPYLQDVFRAADHFALLSPSQLWIIPYYGNDISVHRPARMLTLYKRTMRDERVSTYSNLGRTVEELVRTSNEIKSKEMCTRYLTVSHFIIFIERIYFCVNEFEM